MQIIDRYQISIISFTRHLKYHKPHIKKILVHITNHTGMKNSNRDNSLLPLCHQDTKKEKRSYEVQKRSRLLIVLRLLVIVGLRLIVIARINISKANAENSQLGRSQRVVGVEDRREDRDIGELLERLIPLAVNNLLVAPHNLKALIHHIHTLISAPACGKDTPEHLKNARVGSKSEGGTTTAGSARRSSRITSTRSPWIIGHCTAKRLMTHILVGLLRHHRLNHKLNVWSKITGSERVGGYVPYLIHNVLEDIKAHRLHESLQQVPLISRNDSE
jgi:hypothetical protein